MSVLINLPVSPECFKRFFFFFKKLIATTLEKSDDIDQPISLL